jgi:hypothetical protein
MTTKDLYRHKRTGGIYEVICTATYLPSTFYELVVYRDIETGKIWSRHRDMFFDGRFELVESREVEAPAVQPAVPLTCERVKEICAEAGYDDIYVHLRADFINGIRQAELAHGIKAQE